MNWYRLDGRTPVLIGDVKALLVSAQPDTWKRIDVDYVEDARVSTVFLDSTTTTATGGAPILFESMVFGGALDGEMRRYCTYDEAEAGHAELIHGPCARRATRCTT